MQRKSKENDKKILNLNELLIFPHGMDGLHIWEAGIGITFFKLITNNLKKVSKFQYLIFLNILILI